MAELVSFDAGRASRYIERAFAGFLDDPPDTNYQRGFLAALLALYTEGLGKGAVDARVALLDEMTAPRVHLSDSIANIADTVAGRSPWGPKTDNYTRIWLAARAGAALALGRDIRE